MRRPEQFLIAVATFAVVHAAWGLSGVPECGDADAPQCNGECPSGTRCTQVEIELLAIDRDLMNASANGPQEGSSEEPGCACLEVPCGGIPLEDGEGCCNGDVINASATKCECSGDPRFTACCRNEDPAGNFSNFDYTQYTYNLPIDCCAGTPCGGTCRGAECATSDCCVCEEFLEGEFGPPPVCAGGDSDVGCLIGCVFAPDAVGFFFIPELGIGNQSSVRIEGGTCGAEGCIPPTAPAPATSSTGLAVSIICLAAVGVLALVRRRSRQH